MIKHTASEMISAGLASARSAGLPFVHAAYGFGRAPAPDAVIHSPLELLDIIEV